MKNAAFWILRVSGESRLQVYLLVLAGSEWSDVRAADSVVAESGTERHATAPERRELQQQQQQQHTAAQTRRAPGPATVPQ